MLNTLNLKRLLLITSDIILLYISLLAAILFSYGKKFNWPTFIEHLVPFSILYFFWLAIFYIFGLYDLDIIRAKATFYTRILGGILTALAVGLIFFYLFPIFKLTPRTNLILEVLIFGPLLFFWREIFLALFSTRFLTRIAIIGQNPQTQELIKEIGARPYLGYEIVDFNLEQSPTEQIKNKKIDTLLVPADLVFDPKMIKNLYQCLPTGVKFLDWIRAYEIVTEKIPISFVSHVWFLENLGEREKIFYDRFKRIFDIFLAGVIFITTLPFWLLITLAIKLEDGGSILYSQKRIGKDGVPFFLYKFRSMKKDAENETGPVWASEQDQRATKIGKLLRKTHLDELPQMINVIKEEISLVGPRPERPEFVQQLEKEIPHYHLRHLIRPGFTGWAQIKFRYGRSVMDSREKFQYDLYYLKNRSLFLDLGILLKTFQLFFKR